MATLPDLDFYGYTETMNEQSAPDHHQLPIPQRQFNWYVNFWHVVYLSSLLFITIQVLPNVWQNDATALRMTVLFLLLVVIQAALYLRLIMWNPNWGKGWPLPARDLWSYFGGSLICWFIEWQIEPEMFWFVTAYMGQLFGIAPPIGAIPVTTILYLLIQYKVGNFKTSILNSDESISIVTGWISFVVIYAFIWYLTRTSSERGRLLRQLQEAHSQLAQSREKELEIATLRERERLARDLHDSLGHSMVAMSVQLEAIQRLYKVDAERASAHIDDLKVQVRRSMDELRRSLDGLRAPGLGERPLSQALNALAIEVAKRSGLTIRCQAPSEADSLRPAIAETIWRVAQESLTNVEKHARAHSVQIVLQLEAAFASLRIIDDGIGKSSNAEMQPGHYGLRGLRERVEGLGGTFVLVNGANGTTIETILPRL